MASLRVGESSSLVKGGAIEAQAVLGRTVTIGRRGFGWESVWKGGWFWVKVEGLVLVHKVWQGLGVVRLGSI